jgi:CRISPR/Cas system CSM-associated protein Csm3 (group 7 of RAMP superfamily)
MKPITPESLYDLIILDDVQVSPDGSYAVFTRTYADPSSNDYRRTIWIKDLTKPNAPARPLTAGPKDRMPRWSPDGVHLAFIAERGDKPQVFVLPMRMPGEARSVTAHPSGVSAFAWSRDVRRIAFVARMRADECDEEDKRLREGDPALRDGVAIDPRTRTAEDKKKFDIELLEAGTRFTLRFELLLPEHLEEQQRLLLALAIALQGFERGEIGLGARKRRGLGRCHILGQWTVVEYDLRGRRSDLIAWLKRERPHLKTGSDIATLLGVSGRANLDQRSCLTLRATFALEGSLLIRSSSGDLNAPDSVHLHSRRNGKDVPILSGTSLAGALRARALRIANTLRPDAYQANRELVDALFGVRHTEEEQRSPSKRRTLTASRLVVHEKVIERPVMPELVQSRVKIDRFTGGAYPTALFSEQPVFAKDDTELTLYLELLSPKDYEIGLLLLLLKDLWTGDLPLGGEISVGRGRLRGRSATLSWKRAGQTEEWRIERAGDDPNDSRLKISGDQARLEAFVSEHLRCELFGAEVLSGA